MPPIFIQILLVFLTCFACIASASETSCLISAKHKLVGKSAFAHFNSTSFLIFTMVLGIASNVGIQNIMSNYIISDYDFYIKTIVTTSFCLLVCDLFPKLIATYMPNRILYYSWKAFAPFVKPFHYMYLKLLEIPNAIVDTISYILPSTQNTTSLSELRHILNVCQKSRVISQYEKQHILSNYHLNDTSCEDIHVPVHDVVWIDINEAPKHLDALMKKHPNYYIPICDGEIQHIVSVVAIYDILRFNIESLSVKSIASDALRPRFIHEHASINTAIKMFIQNHAPIFSIDEYGTIKGLITKQSIIKKLLSHQDIPISPTDHEWLSPTSMIVPGDIPLTQLAQLTGIELISHENMKTLGGWITEQTSRISQAGEKLGTKYLSIKIIESSPTKIIKVYLKVLE